MKLIKIGVDPKLKIKHATCKKCESEYEYTDSDPDIQYDTRDYQYGRTKYFVCAICKHFVYIP